VLGVGLQFARRDVTYLLRHPSLLGRSFLAMSVLMPLLALCLTTTFALQPAVAITLVALTLSPVPPFLPGRVIRAGGHGSYMIGLFVTASILSIVVVPASVALIGLVLDRPLHMGAAPIAQLMGVFVLLPLGVGVALHHLAPSFAARAAKPVLLVSAVVIVGACIPLIGALWPAMRTLIGNGTLAAIVALTLAGLGIGHLLGGPEPESRMVLALATAMRHPAVAIAILSANFPEEKLVRESVVLALLSGAIATVPYTLWSKRRHKASIAQHVPISSAA
jgi:bile acid:Na+ symporter, BASS family